MTAALQTVCDLVRYGVSLFEKAGLVYGHGTDNAFDEAAFMVLEALHLPAEQLEAFWNARIADDEKEKILSLFTARVETRQPASYLLGKAWIQGMPFYVDERTIVPRSFIAEILCSENSPVSDPENISRVLDLCTGSGCLAVLSARLFPQAHIDAADISYDALAVARRNIADYGLGDRITLYEGDLFEPLPGDAAYSLVIANPPYVDAEGMAALPPEFAAEPEMALDGGSDGLDTIRRIVQDAAQYLADDGLLICEIGRCGPALQEAFPDMPFSWLETENSSGEVFFIGKNSLL